MRGRGSFDIYDLIGQYKGDVLILHGERDRIVPLRYLERVVDVYENAELVVMEGQNRGILRIEHGFLRSRALLFS